MHSRHLPTLLLALLLAAATGSTVLAQTPATTVKDGSGTVVLQSNADGGLLAPGTFGTGTIPAEGAGTRLMWHPAKAAFRAGQGNFQWNNDYVGSHSVAFGNKTEASGSGAVAMGNQTEATGARAVAMGKKTVAATDNSLTIGQCNSSNLASGDELFVVGNGEDITGCVPSDALVLDDQGNLTVRSQGTFSDRRLKTDIEPLGEGVLQKLSRLRPVRYEFKNQETRPSGEQIGLVAQDVQKEFPQLVRESSGGMLSLAYPKLTAVLLKGLQEQQHRIEKQQDQIGRQQAQIDALRERARQIGNMEQRLATLEADESPVAATWFGDGPLRALGLLLLGGVLGAGLLAVRQ